MGFPKRRLIFIVFFGAVLVLFLLSCSFNYGQAESSESSLPDVVMENVEYVRVRSSDPVARFRAERAERFEERQIMELWNFSFEQFGQKGEEINAQGMVGRASVEIDTGDIRMGSGVRIEVESEDIVIETNRLDWKDKERILSAGRNDEVIISQSDGTSFTGIGFWADARKRSWEFYGGVSGTYIDEDKKEETEEAETDEHIPELTVYSGSSDEDSLSTGE
jgi:LPS export ABC transporter protein LptC